MSTLKVNALNNNGSAIDLPNSFKLGGNPIEQGYTSSATEPTSPNTGDIWWDSANDKLYQYLNGEFKEISLVPGEWDFDVTNLSYDSVSFSSATQENSPLTAQYGDSGNKLYLGGYQQDAVLQYSLSTAYDISTASYDNSTLSIGTNLFGINFSPDGTSLVISRASSNYVVQYNLSTAWDLSTATSGGSYTTSSQAQAKNTIFNGDGTKLYVVNSAVYQYSLSTAYDATTASYDSVSLTTSSQDTAVQAAKFNEVGTKLYVLGQNTDTIYQYNLSTAYDLSTATYSNNSFSLGTQDTLFYDIDIASDGTKLIAMGYTSDTIFQYSTGV